MKEKKFLTAFLFGMILTVFTGTLFAQSIQPVVDASGNLKTISCFVTAVNFSGKRKSEIQYTFSFKREGSMMRIEYLSPRNMKGTKIAIDGSYFYSYLPNLHRTTKRKINPKSTKNPGKDMGLFYDYIKGDFAVRINNFKINYLGKGSVKIKARKGTVKLEAYHYSFTREREREEIWFDSNTKVPVKVMIYNGSRLLLEIDVSEVRLNIEIPDSSFRL